MRVLKLSKLKEFQKEYQPKGFFRGRKRFERDFERHYKRKGLSWFWKLIIILVVIVGFLYLIGKDQIIFDILRYFNLI